MQNEIFFFITAGLSIALIFLLTLIRKDRKKIKELKKQLNQEQQKLRVPYLNLNVDPTRPTLCIINEGDILANNISIEDIATTVDIGFRKTLLIRFKPVDQLKPHESVPLDIQIFEREHALPPSVVNQMSGVLISSSFKAYVHCKNMEGIPYCIELIKEGPKCSINRIAVVE